MNLEEFIKMCEDVKDHHQVTMKRLYDKAFKSWIDDYANEPPKEPRVAALKEQGLNAEDGFFIWSYTGSSSSWLNSDKRNCNNHCSDCKLYFADFWRPHTMPERHCNPKSCFCLMNRRMPNGTYGGVRGQ